LIEIENERKSNDCRRVDSRAPTSVLLSGCSDHIFA